ncbi:MAG: methyltransferase domain-containing protein [Rhodospirillaceae bacterium]|nr:methyltransferase domain-containing protein [Rhodospirillaceae bacterium]
MHIRKHLHLAVLATGLFAAPAFAAMDAATETSLKAALASSDRAPANAARDTARHPLETLKFFGLKNDMAVLEVWPGGGWWTEFLAPVLAEKGRYVGADPSTPDKSPTAKRVKELAAKNPAFAKAQIVEMTATKAAVPAGSMDMVLTFRNIHNWMSDGQEKAMFDAMFAALKPGGYLGVEEHRAKASAPDDKGATGYVKEDAAVKMAEASGFKLVSKSEVNANPKDTKDYPKGVWTLPPNYAEGQKDRAKYQAIGESDRFTLLFQKPAR